eukprot:8559755-Prorocentrum_lima.AAC.1
MEKSPDLRRNFQTLVSDPLWVDLFLPWGRAGVVVVAVVVLVVLVVVLPLVWGEDEWEELGG